jgi:4-hydroxybenzoate polyprenyltransferase
MLMLWFGIGAILMRSAGCIINDMADRKFDGRVERTKARPLASGELHMRQAFILLFLLLAISAAIALHLGWIVILWAALSLFPVVIYPFMKRISWWPQLFLGLTFNWGALMGWAAVRGEVELPALLLYASSIFWTLGYDTIYGHQDKKDDIRIGVKSLALRLGDHTQQGVGLFYVITLTGWSITGWIAGCGLLYFSFLALVGLQLGWQICKAELDNPASCRRIFISNTHMGWLMLAACLSGFI